MKRRERQAKDPLAPVAGISRHTVSEGEHTSSPALSRSRTPRPNSTSPIEPPPPLTISSPLTNLGITGCEPLLELRNAGCHTCPRPRINPVWHHRSCLHGLSRSPCTRIFIRCNVDSAQPQTRKLL